MVFDVSKAEQMLVARLAQAVLDGSMPAEFDEKIFDRFLTSIPGPDREALDLTPGISTTVVLGRILGSGFVKQARSNPELFRLKAIPSELSAPTEFAPSNTERVTNLDLDRTDWFLLGVLFRAAHRNESEGYLRPESFQTWHPTKLSAEKLFDRLDKLEAVKLAITHRILDPDSEFNQVKMYRLSPLGIFFLLQNIDQYYEQKHWVTNTFPDEIYDPVDELFEDLERITRVANTADGGSLAPASDRIVTLDHNSQVYKETISDLEELANKAPKDNRFGDLYADPDERMAVLGQIDGGISLLKNKKVSVGAVTALLKPILSWIAKKLPDATVGALASKILDGLIKLFGAHKNA